MTGRNVEKEILQTAVEMLRKNTGLEVVYQLGTQHLEPRADATLRITWHGQKYNFVAEIKNTLTHATVGAVAGHLQRFQQKALLVTRHVTPQIAERLKELDIPFIDMAGNVYLNGPPLLIFIKGNKIEEELKKQPQTRAFQATGLKVVFAFLCNPGLENAPYRTIADHATVALGTVGWVMTDLKQLGFLVDMKKRGRCLVHKENLLERWVTAYPEQLRPKLLLGRYRAANPEWWKKTNPLAYHAYWGGEVAAGILTGHLKPQIVTLYADQTPGEMLLKNKLKKDPGGDVEVLKKFWKTEQKATDKNLVHPLLIYADLFATGDARNIETARLLYEKEIAQYIRQD